MLAAIRREVGRYRCAVYDTLPVHVMFAIEYGLSRMMETAKVTSPVTLSDITGVASLRKRLGHAATALKVIGVISSVFLWAHAHDPLGWGVIILLLTPGCAFLIAKRVRSGRTWAVALAAIWGILFAANDVAVIFPKFEVSTIGIIGTAIWVVPLYFLARGLFAFTAYRTHQRHDRHLAARLALNPYEEGLLIKRRPKFISKNSMVAYGFLIVSPLPVLLLGVSNIAQGIKIYESEEEILGAQIGAVAIFLAVAAWGVRIYRRARRAAMLPGSALARKDTRPIVLYLRSFQDDSKIKLRARAANGRILPERLLRIPFEEVLTDHLWGYGPVLAIGDPRAKSQPALLGAARDYVDDSTWQQKVIELMQAAAMIVVVAGSTQGLAWEIDTIARLGLLWKLVLVLPPVDMQELQSRWQALASYATSNALPAQIDLTGARAVIFPKGDAVLIVGKKGNDWTYEAVLDEAALMIVSEHDAVLPTAQSLQHLSRPGYMRLVLDDLTSMMAGALLTALALVAIGVSEFRESNTRPLASPSYQRDKFIKEVMEECRRVNPQLSAEQLTKYCTCFADDLADTLTPKELLNLESDRMQAKIKSIAHACSEKTLG
jgi:hypothetical protein